MKPTFALDLTRDVVGLLHRTPKGWLTVGEVALDAPDLDEALDYLRRTALGLSPMGMATKIVLPNSQILYTDVHAPGPSREDKRRQIAAALEGQTPYDVADLVFDWSGKGATLKVAVVARETLAEAEHFAASRRLNPVSFVAIPDDGAFVGEPFFGPTEAAASILAPGETVEKDREPVIILHRDLPVSDPPPAAVASAASVSLAEPDAEPAPAPDRAPDPEEDPLPGLAEALDADLREPDVPVSATIRDPEFSLDDPLEYQPDSLPGGGAEAAADPAAEARPEPAPEPPSDPSSDPSSELAALPADAQPSGRPVSVAQPADEVEEAPFAHVADSVAFPDDDPAPAQPAPPAPAVPADDDLPPVPPSAALVAFASRRSALAGAPPRPAEDASAAARLGAAVPPRPAAGKGFQGLVTAPSIPGTRGKSKGKPGGLPGEVPRPAFGAPGAAKSPTRPGGTFGTTVPPRNRTGIVFAVLVGMLLLFLAVIAAWSSLYLARNAGQEAVPAPIGVAAVRPDALVVPDVEDEMLADMQDPEGMTAPLPEAVTGAAGRLDPELLATEPGETVVVDLPPAPAPSDAPTPSFAPTPSDAPVAALPEPGPEPAPAAAISTEVAAAPAPVEVQDEIFLSAMDAPPPALFALALPVPAATADALPLLPAPPPPFGTVYRFDAQGLLVPTPEGIVSPDGVMLVAGRPPLVPPARSDAAAAAAAANAPAPPASTDAGPTDAGPTDDTAAQTAQSAQSAPTGTAGASLVTTAPEAEAVALPPPDPALAGFRPLPRPGSLVPQVDPAAPAAETPDDASLTPADPSLNGLRPLARPETVLAAAAAAAPPADLGAQAASLTAQAEAQLAEAAALQAQNPSIVAISKRPQARPGDLSDAVAAAVAAAVRAPEPEPEPVEVAAAAPAPELKPEEEAELDEPEVAAAAPSIPTRASVAKQATFTNAINLSRINLIGTYGTDSRRTALIRQANGRFKKVSVGDRIDGGTIQAITETEVRYQKGNRLITLEMPRT